MKIVFFGTPSYVIPVLDALHKEFKGNRGESPIAAVVTQPPKPVGRSHQMEYSAVDHWAHKKGIPIYFDSKKIIFDKVQADLGVVASYGAMIPKEVLSYFKYGLLNIHPSALPEFRGASPVQAMLITGKDIAHVSIMKVDELMDHGPIVSQFKEDIRVDDTTEILRDRLFARAAEVLVGLIPAYLDGKIRLKAQDHSKAVYTRILKKEDGFIPVETLLAATNHESPTTNHIEIPFIYTKDKEGNRIPYELNPTSENISRFIQTMNPWPSAWTLVKINDKEMRLKILKAHVEEILVLDEVQLEGKNSVSWKQFKEAYPQVKI